MTKRTVSKKQVLLVFIIILSVTGLFWYFGLLGIIASILWSVLLVVLTNLDRTADVVASSYKWMSKVDFWFEKNAVEKRLEVTINTSSKRINREAGCDLLPHGIDIKWDVPQNRDAFIERGKMVVVLEPSNNEERNLARATIMYVQEDLIAASQRFVDATVMKSLCFVAARKMLMLDRKLQALKCLNNEFIEPEVVRNPAIMNYVSGLENIDKQGYFTRILLREFSRLEAILPPILTDPKAETETKSLILMLKDLVEKDENKTVPLDVKGSILRVSIMPVADITKFNVDNFVKVASHLRAEDVNTIYIIARGANVELARIVVEEIGRENLYTENINWQYQMLGRKNTQIKGYVAELSKV